MDMTLESPALPGRGRTGQWVWLLWLGVLGGLGVTVLVIDVTLHWNLVGVDYVFYRDVGARWLADGSYYWPHQLAGPYDVALMVDVLYPPAALLLFVPMVWLPAVVWWLIPLGIIGYCLAAWRPTGWWLVPIIALALWPRTVGAVMHGNTDMWVSAAVAAGLRWRWPAAFLALKPFFLPLAIAGIRHPATYVVGAALVLVSLPLAGGYIAAMHNAKLDVWGYSATSIPFALLPVVGWFGRSR